MKATSKQEFFELLGYELNRLGIEDTTSIFVDFEDHFSEGFINGIPENEIAEGLGDIKEIARSYLNIESSRFNSIIARDVERAKISLTKPGRSVPADLSLLKENNASSQNITDILNSDNIRSYTPEHIAQEEIPNPTTGQGGSNENAASQSANSTAGGSASGTTNYIPNYGSIGDTGNAGNSGNSGNTDNSAKSANPTVSEAFSEAGRAAVDAAKVAGHAIADAFAASNVKSAVSKAGKSAAEAVKTAGKSATDAINKAKTQHEQEKARAKAQNSDFAETPKKEKLKEEKTGKPFSKPGDFKGMKADVNAEKLVVAILLDIFLWSWLLPTIFSCILGVFCSGFGIMFEYGFGAFGASYYFISRVFLAVAFCSLGGIIALIGAQLFKLLFKLIRFIVVLHYKAVYNV